jgi:hypothetical protein
VCGKREQRGEQYVRIRFDSDAANRSAASVSTTNSKPTSVAAAADVTR